MSSTFEILNEICKLLGRSRTTVRELEAILISLPLVYERLKFLFIYLFLPYLKGREMERDILYTSSLSSEGWARNQELHQSLNYLRHHLLPPRVCISRELDRNREASTGNRQSDIRHGSIMWQH